MYMYARRSSQKGQSKCADAAANAETADVPESADVSQPAANGYLLQRLRNGKPSGYNLLPAVRQQDFLI